jgi:succinyl-CoA synthetase alpha subunit
VEATGATASCIFIPAPGVKDAAIVSGGKGTAAAKMEALRDAGVEVGLNPTEAGELMARIVSEL